MSDTSNAPAQSKPAFDKARLEKDVSWIGARLREPSTYAGLAAVLGVMGLGADPGLVKNISMIGMGLGGLLSSVLPEAK
jgi:hypothetical protein